MNIREEDLHGSFKDRKRLVGQFNLMDDTFFSVVIEDKAACEYLLSRLLEMPVRYIKNNKTQFSIRNAEQHSIVLDALVEDAAGTRFDIEVQVGDNKNFERRTRYYGSAIDCISLKKGRDYSELRDVYISFISDFDPFKRNKVRYEVKKYVDGDFPYEDGKHIIYFNTAVNDGTPLSELMSYFKNSAAGNEDFGALSNMVNYYKSKEKGVDTMCKAVEDYAERRGAEIAKKSRAEGRAEEKAKTTVMMIESMLDSGMSMESALKIAKIDQNTYVEYKKQAALYT